MKTPSECIMKMCQDCDLDSDVEPLILQWFLGNKEMIICDREWLIEKITEAIDAANNQARN